MKTGDSFNLEKTSDHEPALGHSFGPDLVCKCGREWEEQDRLPTICPLLLVRLRELENFDRTIRRALREKNREIGRLNTKVMGLVNNLHATEQSQAALAEAFVELGGWMWAR